MRQLLPSTLTVLALICAPFASSPAIAQQPGALQHVAPDAMSAADRHTLADHRRELSEAARIYGYNLAEGNWSYEQTRCAPLPDTLLLHYTQRFPDGTESLFTALVPRRTGHVRIVPVLYRSATPFVPAPKNPENYALFNKLVKATPKDAVPGKNWFDSAACYAEMTGGRIDLYSDPEEDIGIAGAPSPRVNIEPKDKTARVTVASREGVSAYKVWSISFDRNGRVLGASTEDKSVAVARMAQPPTTPESPSPDPSQQTAQSQQRTGPAYPQPAAEAASAGVRAEPAPNTQIATAAPKPVPSSTNESVSRDAAKPSDAPGWKYIPRAPDPPTKIVPPAPPPRQKIIPAPPNPWEQPSQTPQ